MQYRIIPETELNASVISFGGNTLSVLDGQAQANDLLDLYCKLGGNFIDTANIYGKWLEPAANYSEQYIGSWLKTRHCRHQIILATKGAHPAWTARTVARLSRQDVLADLHESLQALQTDYIDLYYLHRDDEQLPVEEILDYLNDWVKAGLIRAFGCSNWKADRIREARTIAARKGWQGFAANQMMWSLARPDPAAFADPTMVAMDEASYELHRTTQLAAVAYSAQAGGYFDKLAAGGKVRITADQHRLYDSPANDRRLELARHLAAGLNCNLTEIVLGYLLAQPFPTFPIVGSRTPEQLRASLKAGDRHWPVQIIETLNEA